MSTTNGRPFDLEAAKRGEPITNFRGEHVAFIGVASDGRIVNETSDGAICVTVDCGLRMAPKKRTIYILRSALDRNKGEWCKNLTDINEDGSKVIALEVEL